METTSIYINFTIKILFSQIMFIHSSNVINTILYKMGYYLSVSVHHSSKNTVIGEQEWWSGESTCLPPMWPGFDSRTWRQLWVEFVVGSCPCSERFFSGHSGFPFPQKPTFPKSNLIWNPRATGLSVVQCTWNWFLVAFGWISTLWDFIYVSDKVLSTCLIY